MIEMKPFIVSENMKKNSRNERNFHVLPNFLLIYNAMIDKAAETKKGSDEENSNRIPASTGAITIAPVMRAVIVPIISPFFRASIVETALLVMMTLKIA
jgi:hypothetical protein